MERIQYSAYSIVETQETNTCSTVRADPVKRRLCLRPVAYTKHNGAG